ARSFVRATRPGVRSRPHSTTRGPVARSRGAARGPFALPSRSRLARILLWTDLHQKGLPPGFSGINSHTHSCGQKRAVHSLVPMLGFRLWKEESGENVAIDESGRRLQ